MGPAARYPLAADRDWTPPDRPVESYEQTLNRLGIARGVIVHSSSHGTDNRVTVDALAHMAGRCRGIALLEPCVDENELERLDAAGMRGIRISTMLKGAMSVAHIKDTASRLKGLGWHIELHFGNAREILELLPLLRSLGVDIVFDHMGRVRGENGVAQPAFQCLLKLLEDCDHCWVKISSWYRLSGLGPPYVDMRPFAEALMDTRVDRVLWGSNWPHPMLDVPPPDDAELLDQFQEWAGEARYTVLVDNPARLYRFELPSTGITNP